MQHFSDQHGEFMKSKNSSIIIIMAVLPFILDGCAVAKVANPTGMSASSYQSASSTKIGCLPEEITITDLNRHSVLSHARDWFASCKGQTYFCSGVNDGYGGTTNVSCIQRSSNNTKEVATPTAETITPTETTKGKKKNKK